MSRKKALTAALKASSPVFFGYISIGFAYGFLLVKSGFEWYWAPVMSLTIFAGAAQFMAISLINQNKSFIEMGLAIFLLNARHMVYGFSVLERYAPFKRFKKYLIFGLTDETYALITTIKPPEGADPEFFDFCITALNQSYWTLGGILGALLGTIISWNAPGLDFALTALFVVLMIEQIRTLKRPAPFLLGLAAPVLLYLTGLTEQALFLGIVISSAGCFFMKKSGTDAGEPETVAQEKADV
ncbi:MAG: AzlC family ABC transporter permease [Spirochaetales bacterium]|uniref:AzlC family ABC transporter permease n=1 Tax=Candidatus Thalassospirochaeta sargassi TaxID=3119039 RepID=A0AAJ1MIJ0_9SPIO|nr:AzlC family ABC transporter permease [Spirochaetales bacterium]